jgi:hypothetical protein
LELFKRAESFSDRSLILRLLLFLFSSISVLRPD